MFRGLEFTVWGPASRIWGKGLGGRRLRLDQDLGLGFWGGWGLEVLEF